MATKAQRFHAESMVENSARKSKVKPKAAARRAAPIDKPHNLGARAGRTARVAYEASNGQPSRKSTRGSAHHQRAASQLERTEQLKQRSPEARFARSRVRSTKVRGKT